MNIRRVWAMPNRETFKIGPIMEFVRWHTQTRGIGIDPFARDCKVAKYTNDLDPSSMAEFHMEAREFLEMLLNQGVKADYVVFDPPYSLEQCKRSYDSIHRKVTMRDTQVWRRWTDHKNIISELLNPGGIVLGFGWDSAGMGLKRNFVLEDMLVVCHGSGHNDTICIAERKQ